LYKKIINKEASNEQVVKSGKIFGWVLAIFSMSTAPLLMRHESIFAYLQKMNGLYFIPIFSIVICGMLFKKVPPIAAKIALLTGITIIGLGYFVKPFTGLVNAIHEFHFLGLVFLLLVIILLGFSKLIPMVDSQNDSAESAVDMTPWPMVKRACVILLITVLIIYGVFADF
jgi:SSS family solute:Na+ symporter